MQPVLSRWGEEPKDLRLLLPLYLPLYLLLHLLLLSS